MTHALAIEKRPKAIKASPFGLSMSISGGTQQVSHSQAITFAEIVGECAARRCGMPKWQQHSC